jgi:hypothetical protein
MCPVPHHQPADAVDTSGAHLAQDLGGDDTIWPVVETLEWAAFENHPFDIGVINVHSAKPGGAAKDHPVLRHWGYPSASRRAPQMSAISTTPAVN